ncbi:MAG TPA: hypothetical protein O0X97_06270 [Methanocorpusculum sp.]|nr:hypothetical protein [Methanocorpusculum sp.]
MSDITTFVIGLVVCMAVAVLLTIVQMRLKKRAEAKKASSAGNQGAEKKPAFTVGRIYQMEDGSLAKYIGDNKFVKVKEK